MKKTTEDARREAERLPRHPGWGGLLPQSSGSGALYAWVQAQFPGPRGLAVRLYVPLHLPGRKGAAAIEFSVREGWERPHRHAACDLTQDELASALAAGPARAAAAHWHAVKDTLGDFPVQNIITGGTHA